LTGSRACSPLPITIVASERTELDGDRRIAMPQCPCLERAPQVLAHDPGCVRECLARAFHRAIASQNRGPHPVRR
jgi:hypothetical protein